MRCHFHSNLLLGDVTRRRGVGAASRTAVVVGGTVVIGIIVGAIVVGICRIGMERENKMSGITSDNRRVSNESSSDLQW